MKDIFKPIFDNPFKDIKIYLVDKNGNVLEDAHIKSIEIFNHGPYIKIRAYKENYPAYYFNSYFIAVEHLNCFLNEYYSLFFDKKEAKIRSLNIQKDLIDKEYMDSDKKIEELENRLKELKDKQEVILKQIVKKIAEGMS